MGFLSRLLLWPVRFAFGFDLGPRQGAGSQEIQELLDDLYETAYARLAVRLISLPPPPGSPSSAEPVERIEIEGGAQAEQRMVNDWVAEHDGPGTLALSLFVQDQILTQARNTQDYRDVPLPPMASGFVSQGGFQTALWLWFRQHFPPYVKLRHYRDLNMQARGLEELSAAVNRRSLQDLNHANRAAGRGQPH